MAEEKYNRKNPAVKRILQEVKEMQSNPSDDFMSLPLEENIFEWHFAIRGPSDTEFEGGIYHGRIQLPADYPFKPPSFMLLSPNGRFETQTKICLSISNHHPEHWQPSWSVRTALVALIAFMPTSPNGALGSLDYTKEERRALAVKSRQTAPKFGSPERQQLIDEIHEYLLSKAPSVSQVSSSQSSAEQTADPHIEAEGSSGNASADATQDGHSDPASANTSIEEQEAPLTANSAPMSPRSDSVPNTPAIQPSEQQQQQHVIHRQPERTVPRNADDRLFTWAAIGLTLAIVVLLLKKYMKANGHGALFTDES